MVVDAGAGVPLLVEGILYLRDVKSCKKQFVADIALQPEHHSSDLACIPRAIIPHNDSDVKATHRLHEYIGATILSHTCDVETFDRN